MHKYSLTLSNFLADPVRWVSGPVRRDDRGVTAVEYGLMVALIAVVIIVAVLFLGHSLSDLFSKVGNTIKNP